MDNIMEGFASIHDINEALDIFDEFYIISALSAPWSKTAYFKCDCSDCRRDGGCYHSAAVSLLCDDDVYMPPKYYMHGIPMKRNKGRPAASGDKAKKDLEEEEPQIPRKKAPVIYLLVVFISSSLIYCHVLDFMGAFDVFTEETYVEGSCSTCG